MAICGSGMAKRTRDTPGDHLLDCVRNPRRALERAALREIPLTETLLIALVGLLGLGWAMSGLLYAGNMAFERFIYGAGSGLAMLAPVALFLGAVNALQPPGDGEAATLKTSLAIVGTALVLPSIVTISAGVGAFALSAFTDAAWAATAPALLALGTWTVLLVGQAGMGHALRRRGSMVAGIGTALAALLVTALGAGLTVWILLNPPWAKEELWKFL